ncbi:MULTISPECIES: hypothetical protein [Streptomyces]|uniref:Uncharacterized protein n=1 Tax=Streptomyces chartreusis NRRL 3882 TaxID=1079985 RepID=A0A2N9BEC6_STRCX|nr:MULTISPECIES: hypothetical protein [Streptomyces]MYS92595.1 hypothetical protein [Streptomyces sp. SID5464]SOR81713.1 hypothetical protein SCNRRL3882_5165 [Streptomyces chartreusis NRRL 3882]
MLRWNLPPGFTHTRFEQLRLDVQGRRFATWQEWRRYSLVTTPFALRAASPMMRVAGLPAEPDAIASVVPEAAVASRTAADAIILTDALVGLSEDLADGHVPRAVRPPHPPLRLRPPHPRPARPAHRA